MLVNVKASRGRTRFLGGTPKREACFDLIMVDMPDGLYVPGAGVARPKVPSWNILTGDWAEPIFEVARSQLQDDGATLS